MRAQVVVVAALVLVIGCLAGLAPAANEQPAARACFPASSWDAAQADRPCVSADRPQEDGSVRIVQGTATTARAVCVLPNPTEETGRYVARCWRLRPRPVPAAAIVQNNAAGFCIAPVAGNEPGTFYTRCYRR
jgi:hypothetical protein